MNLIDGWKLKQRWRNALLNKSNIVFMRHGPKDGSDGGLTAEGEALVRQYGEIIRDTVGQTKLGLVHTDKPRTVKTLELMFPDLAAKHYYHFSEFNSPPVSDWLQNEVYRVHRLRGHDLGYLPQHTHYFLRQLGGKYDEQDPFRLAEMISGFQKIAALVNSYGLVIFCGHSPSIEVFSENACHKSLSELGHFLNPLDSLHFKCESQPGIQPINLALIARINPIAGYVDAEEEAFYNL